MEVLQTLVPILLTLSLAGLVMAVGLNASRHDLLYVLTRPKLLQRAVLAVLIIPPLVAGLLAAVAPLDPIARAGIMLMAVSPVPPLVPGKELGVGGRKNYAYGLYVAMALLTIISVPLAMAVAATLFGRQDFVSISSIAQTIFLGVLLPLSLGLAIRALSPGFASRAWSIVYRISMAVVLLAFLPIVIKAWPAIAQMVGNGTLVAMATVTAVCLAAGHMLGGPELRDRATLATASSVRHPGIAMASAGAAFHDPRVSAAILLFMLVGMVVSIPYTAWVRRGPPSKTAHA
jgi:BASS family bile acid:Na+ symporter